MKAFFRYLVRTYNLELKRVMVYKASLIISFIILPLWTVIQLMYVETLFKQTGSFIGYTRYEAYLFFGAYRIVQGLSNLNFTKRIMELKFLIRGESQETFDQAILKPIDLQLFSSFGRVNFTGIVHMLVGIGLTVYAIKAGHIMVTVMGLLAYFYLILLGTILWYLSQLFVRSLTFWFEELDSSDAVQRELMTFGRNPSSLYKGTWGVILNLVIPLTLMGSIPAEVLLGKRPLSSLLIYTFVIAALAYLVRMFWQLSVKKYSSFSS